MLFSQLIRIQLHKTALTSCDMKHERLTRLRSFFQIKHFNRISIIERFSIRNRWQFRKQFRENFSSFGSIFQK